MSEVSVEQHIAVVKEVGVLRGQIDGVKEKQNEQREDIKALHEDIETLRRDMIAGLEKLQGALASTAMNAAQLTLSQAREQGLFASGDASRNPGTIARTGTWVRENPVPSTIIGVLALALAAVTQNPALLQFVPHS